MGACSLLKRPGHGEVCRLPGRNAGQLGALDAAKSRQARTLFDLASDLLAGTQKSGEGAASIAAEATKRLDGARVIPEIQLGDILARGTSAIGKMLSAVFVRCSESSRTRGRNLSTPVRHERTKFRLPAPPSLVR